MPEFFVPAASSDQQEDALSAIREFVEEQHYGPLTLRRLYRLHYHHDCQDLVATVGDPHPETGEVGVAILESDRFILVCTPTRGVVRGMPILVGLRDVSIVEEFSRVPPGCA